MTDTITGTLTDYDLMMEGEFEGFYGARIDDKPYVVMHHVDTFLTRLKKGAAVEVNLNKDGHISKIRPRTAAPAARQQAESTRTAEEIAKERQDYNAKAKAHGFGEPTTGPAKTAASVPAGEQKKECCTSPSPTPAATPSNSTGLKTVEGQIVVIDHPAHKITVKDRQGSTHTFIWPPGFNDAMAKLKQWWFVKVTGEQEKEFPDLWRLTAQDFFKRPDDWPASPHGGQGGRAFVPRNEKIITYQTCYKEACETVRSMMDGWKKIEVKQEDEFNRLMDIALARAKKDAKELCEAAGVQ